MAIDPLAKTWDSQLLDDLTCLRNQKIGANYLPQLEKFTVSMLRSIPDLRKQNSRFMKDI